MAKDCISAIVALAGCIFLWVDVLAWSPVDGSLSSTADLNTGSELA